MGVRETEFKYSLQEAEYEAVVARLGEPQSELNFANRYYDVEGGTDRRDWVLRLRVTENQRELTLKIGRELKTGIFDSQEYNSLVDKGSPEEWEGEESVRVLRQEISTAPILVQGESLNKRFVYSAPIPVGEIWELDKTILPGGKTVYELEVEVVLDGLEQLSMMKEQLEGWLSDTKVSIVPSSKTKYARFLEAVGER